MKVKRFFHSFSSLPCVKQTITIPNALKFNYILYATSLLSAKENYPDAEFSVHTDKYSYDIFKNMPYDNVYNDLNILEKINPFFFAYGKILSMEKESLDSIYIDGDVFLRSNFLNKINDENIDLLCLGYEDAYKFTTISYYMKDSNIDYSNTLNKTMINCGFLKFYNDKLKLDWIDSYKKYTDFLNNNDDLKDYKILKNRSLELNTEQINLYSLSIDYKVRTLFKKEYKFNIDNLKHYIHLMTEGKFHIPFINDCLLYIKSKDQKLFDYLYDLVWNQKDIQKQ